MAERRLLQKRPGAAPATASLIPGLQELAEMLEARKRARGMAPAERTALAKESLARSGARRARDVQPEDAPSNFDRIMRNSAAAKASGRRGADARGRAGLSGPQRSAFDEGSLANRSGRVNLSEDERNENRFLAEFGRARKGKRRG